MTAPEAPRSTIEDDRGPLPFGPGVVVAFLAALLVIVIGIGIWLNNRESTIISEAVTIADLRADPSRYDNTIVSIDGRVESVRQLPILDQYALYTLRDDTGSMTVLSQHGAPPGGDVTVRLVATYHASVTLDDELRSIVKDRLGSIPGELVRLIPGFPLNVVFLEQERYELP